MPVTNVRGGRQIVDGSIIRDDLNITTSGQALIRRLLVGTGISFVSSTGADSGTGDVTIQFNTTFGDARYQLLENQRLSTTNNVTFASIVSSGNITGASFIRSGGTSSQFLKADGSVDSTVYHTGNSIWSQVFSVYAIGANTPITSSDTLETALEKLQGQVSARLTTESDTLGTVTGRGAIATTAITLNVDTTNAVINVNNNGNAERWYGRIASFNSTTDRAVFMGVYQNNAVVAGHNNALSAWAPLYINTVDGAGGGTIYMPPTVLINNNQALHAGNFNSYSPSLTGNGASGTWGINITGSAGSLSTNTTYMVERTSVAAAAIDTATANGFYNQNNTTDTSALLVFTPGATVGTVQLRFTFTGTFEYRNRTDGTTWNAWKNVINDAGSYANPSWITSLAWSKITGAPSFLTANQNITISGDASGSGTTAITLTLANSGVTAGTYRSVTVDAKGRVTAGTNPTTLSGYGITDAVPSNRTITINGTSQDLSTNRTFTVPAYKRILVNGSGLTEREFLNLSTEFTAADDAVNVWTNISINSIAWSKITGAPAFLTSNQTITLSGEASGSGTTSISVTLANSAVIGKVLTGYTVGSNTAIAATDTILQAFQKVQGQINARLTSPVQFSQLDIGTSGNWWTKAIGVDSSGGTEVGRWIDFHNTSNDTSDFSSRLRSDVNAGHFDIQGTNLLLRVSGNYVGQYYGRLQSAGQLNALGSLSTNLFMAFADAIDGAHYGPILNVGSLNGGYVLQMSSNYTSNTIGVKVRTRNGDNGTWNNWRDLAIQEQAVRFGNIGINKASDANIGLDVLSPSVDSLRMLRDTGNGGLSVTDTAGNILFGTSNTAGTSVFIGARLEMRADGNWTTGSSHPSSLLFYTISSGSATLTERMRINSSGNVGINTNNPTQRLHVIGNGLIDNLLFPNTDGAGIKFFSANGNDHQIVMAAQSVSGYGRMSGETTSDYNIYFRNTGGTNRGFVFQNGTTNVAGIDGGGNMRLSGSITATGGGFNSLRKLKDIIGEYTGSGIHVTKTLKIQEFIYKSDINNNRTIGLILDEISEGKEYLIKDSNAINLYSLIGLNIKTNQEIISEVELLKIKIKELEDKLNGMGDSTR